MRCYVAVVIYVLCGSVSFGLVIVDIKYKRFTPSASPHRHSSNLVSGFK